MKVAYVAEEEAPYFRASRTEEENVSLRENSPQQRPALPRRPATSSFISDFTDRRRVSPGADKQPGGRLTTAMLQHSSSDLHTSTSPRRTGLTAISSQNLPAAVPTSTQSILSKVFDEELSIHSPSRKKKLNMLKKQISHPEEDEEYKDHKPLADSVLAARFSNYQDALAPEEQVKGRLRRSYETLTESMHVTEELSLNDRVMRYTAALTSPSKEMRLGALQGISDLLQGPETFTASLKELTLGEVLQTLEGWEQQDSDFLECALGIVGNIGPHPLSLERLPLLISLVVHDETTEAESLHLAAFYCMCKLGLQGLDALVRLASKDYPHLQQWILSKLATISEIQRQILVPALINDSLSTSSGLKTEAVAALGRMYSLVWEGGALPVLLQLIQEGSVERQLVACAIRGAGPIGETTLVKLLKQSDNPKVRMAAASALCWRVPKRPRQLDIHLVTQSLMYEEMRFPGSLCRFVGPLVPVILQEANEEAYLEVNSRDFLACLQRYVRQEGASAVFPHQPQLPGLNSTLTEEKEQVSVEAVKALCYALRDEFEGVRETATYALGLIGLPEAADAAPMLARLLFDVSPQVRTMTAWAVGRLGSAAWQAGEPLIALLKDGYWKVRTAACIALAAVGQSVSRKALEALSRALKDGSINRGTVAETMVRMGFEGERLLIHLLNQQPYNNIKLRVGIIQALAQANVHHTGIDFVVESLFRTTQDQMAAVRRESLMAIHALQERARGAVTYLKPRGVLPLYFKFLRDSDKDVRDTALGCIVAAGPQGQLVLIEGLTKDENALVRAYSAKGLGLFGPSTFRTLLLGLHDTNPMVRK